MRQARDKDPVEQWTKRPGKAIPYGVGARFSDWWCAGRDAKVAVKGTEDEAVTTPRMIVLGQLGRGWAEKAWMRHQADTSATRLRLTEVRARRAGGADELAKATTRLSGLAEPTDEQLKARANGEERTPDDIRAARRLGEHARHRQGLRAEVTRLRAELAEHDAEIARLEEVLRTRFESVRTQARIIEAHIRRRRAAYLTRLVRKHKKGQELGLLLRPDWDERPEWSVWTAAPGLLVDSAAPDAAPTGGR
jgi:hypothetical protein